MQRFTEIYYDDALRFAQYIQATEGGDIELVREDSVGFPMPAKNRVFGDMVDCLKIRKMPTKSIRTGACIDTSSVSAFVRLENLTE